MEPIKLPGDETKARWWEVRRRVTNATSVLSGSVQLLWRSVGLVAGLGAAVGSAAVGALALLRRFYAEGILVGGAIAILIAGGVAVGGLVFLLCVAIAERWREKGASEALVAYRRVEVQTWPAWRSIRVVLSRVTVSAQGPLRVYLTVFNTSPRVWTVEAVRLRWLIEEGGALRTVETDDTFSFGLAPFVLNPAEVVEVSGKDHVRGGDPAAVRHLWLGRQMSSGLPGLLTGKDDTGQSFTIVLLRPKGLGERDDAVSEHDYRRWCHDLPVTPKEGGEV